VRVRRIVCERWRAAGTTLFYAAVHTVFGLLGLAGFVVCMLLLSAGVTALVVKIWPTR
jgi:hypothetical protein